MVDRFMGMYLVSLLSQPMKQWGQSQLSIDSRLLGLLDPYHRHVIGMLNTCSRGPSHRFLTDTGIGYNLGGVGFPHTTPRYSQPTVSTFHLRAPPGLQFNQVLSTKLEFEFNEPISAIYSGLQLRLAIANDLSLAIGSLRIDRKVILMQLRHQFNSYNLMKI
jgi:hypothetical protein